VSGFLTIPLLGAVLGLRRLADAFNVANVLPNILFEIVLGGLMGSVLLPLFAERREQLERDDYRREVAAASSLLIAALALLSLAASAAAPWVVATMTTRADDPALLADAAFFFRFFAFQIAFYGIAGLASVLLNIEGKFALAAGAPMLNNLIVIAGLAAYWLMPTTFGIAGLALATTAGVAAMAIVQLIGLRRLGLRLFGAVRGAGALVSRAFLLGAPLLALVLVQQAGVVVRANLASEIEGGFAALQYVHRFFQLPYGLLAVTIFTLVMPGLSRAVSRRAGAEVARETARALRWGFAVMLPATLLYAFLAPWLMRLVMSWGAMRPSGTALLGELLSIYALGVFPYAMMMLGVRVLYAHQATLAASLVQAATALLHIVLAIALFRVGGLHGIALAALLSFAAGGAIALTAAWRTLAWTRSAAPAAA
jgi:putative peptidoglycan lipid II flippase